MEFITNINSFHPTIKFTTEWSRSSVTFFDTIVSIKEGYLVTDLYTKLTATHQYLHRSSCHPIHCKNTIAYSQALRLWQICTNKKDYLHHTQELKAHLVRRGYEKGELQGCIDKATNTDRGSLLQPEVRKSKQITPFVVTYHPDLPPFQSILRKHQCVIDISPRLKGALLEPPLVAFRRSPNLRTS